MAKRSAGILLYRTIASGEFEVLLVHPGGPLWRRRNAGAWQIPKGMVEAGEDEEAAARRETFEELGARVFGPLIALGEIRQAGGKIVIAFAAESDFDPAALVSNMVEIVWPPRTTGRLMIPEVDEARWLRLDEARALMLVSQVPLLDRLEAELARS